MAKRGPKGPLTDEHKRALAAGRREGRIVRTYLEATRAERPKQGPRRTKESVEARCAALNAELSAVSDPVKELLLLQERRDLKAVLARMTSSTERRDAEDAFVNIAAAYGERNGIDYATWREFGVEATVLSRAGIE